MNPVDSLPPLVRRLFTSTELVGSRVTCNPPPEGTDLDVLCHVDAHKAAALESALQALGWEAEGSDAYPDALSDGAGFVSFRKDDVNLIVTSDDTFYRRFVAASSVAKRLNLLNKEDRVALFQAVLYGNACDDVPEYDDLTLQEMLE